MTTSSSTAAAAATTIGWVSGEFGAANAIIDALCEHLREIGGEEAYQGVFDAIGRRRTSWFPFLTTSTGDFYPITDVTAQLHGLRKTNSTEEEEEEEESEIVRQHSSDSETVVISADSIFSDDRDSTTADPSPSSATISQRNLDCKRFVAKEHVKGHMVNVVKGLKEYKEILTELELSKLHEFINDLRVAGRNGDLSGDTYFFFNKQLMGNRREVVQFGVPVFQPTVTEEQQQQHSTTNIEPIPSILEDLVDHLLQWRLIPETKRPNSCVISFFDEGDHSQPYSKPPHLENPITKLVLHDTTMAFGKALVSDQQGDFNGCLRLSLKKGSLLVMRGHSADMAKHVVCPSPNTRVTITFARVRQSQQKEHHLTATTILPASSSNMAAVMSSSQGCGLITVPTSRPAWLATSQLPQLQPVTPVVMVPTAAPVVSLPIGPMVARAGRSGGTGVFLPWTMGPKRHIKQLPPRIQKKHLPSLPPRMQMQEIPCIGF